MLTTCLQLFQLSVEPIQKEESSNFIQSVMILVQIKAASANKSEKGNNSEAFPSTSYKSTEIGSARDSIDVKKIENEDNAWKQDLDVSFF